MAIGVLLLLVVTIAAIAAVTAIAVTLMAAKNGGQTRHRPS